MKFVTYTDKKYLPGLFALLQSLKENSSIDIDEMIIVCEEIIPKNIISSLTQIGIPLYFLNRNDLGDIKSKDKQLQSQHELAFKKILLFKLPLNEKIAYVDVDMVCMNSLKGINLLPTLSVAPDIGISKTPRLINGFPMFNTGFMIFQPSNEIFQELRDYILNSEVQFNDLGDQTPINAFFYQQNPSMVNMIDPCWNTLKRVALRERNLLHNPNLKLLHFVGRKPWESPIYKRTEMPYISLYRFWFNFFENSGGLKHFPSITQYSNSIMFLTKLISNKLKWS